MIPKKTIERLTLYRQLLVELQGNGTNKFFSYQLAAIAGVTSAQLRKNLTLTAYYGSLVHCYDIKQLLDKISKSIYAPQMQNVALVGLDHLGCTVLDYFQGRRSKQQMVRW